ncbi:MAG TPA: GNAT family N-acetyltransferase, partial [Candidatus Ozemobacteraceae bacterium]|nr:GNAT family N-acetyltransferase [Candidatus Ozemobacteraceae bacterium]
EEWNAHLAGFSPQYRDIYFTYGWHDLFARDIGAAPRAFLFEGARGTRVLYPFLLRKIPERFSPSPLFACESAYGYGGPLTEAPDPADLAMADDAFCDWARTSGIVAEFLRFHPLLDTHRWFRRDVLIEENRPTVTVPLDAPYEQLFQRFSPAKRRNIRKADKAGIVVRRGEDFDGFWRLYEATMSRLAAARFYRFSEEHRARLERLVRSSGFLLEARISGRLVGAAVFLRSAGFLHFHLGGSDEAFLGAAPNDRLMAEAVRLGLETGAGAVHLGGGATTDAGDTLLRFKKGFSPTLTLFRTGKRVHQPALHDLFLNLRREETGARPSRFLEYLDDI